MSSNRTSWSTVFTTEMFSEAVKAKLADVEEFILAGEAGWRREMIAKHKESERLRKKALREEERKNQVYDAGATCIAYEDWLKENFPNDSDYTQFNNKWISMFDVPGQFSAKDLEGEVSDAVEYTKGVTLYRVAVSHGAKPKGVVSHAAKKEGDAFTLKYPLRNEKTRVYVGTAMPLRSIKESHDMFRTKKLYTLPEPIEEPAAKSRV